MPMKKPPHPGGLVLRECIEPLGLTTTDAAAANWLTQQAHYDLAQIRTDHIKLKRLELA